MYLVTPALITEITTDISSVADDASLYEVKNFNGRANALDFMEFHIIDRLDSLPSTNELSHLKQSATKVKRQLESIDTRLFDQLREDIRNGVYAGPSFARMIHEYTGFTINNTEPNQPGYDNLDTFINGLLTDQPLPELSETHNTEIVFYQQTPARIIFQLAARANLQAHDVLVDIGSGLGHVPILVNLISSAAAKGIEYQPAYCTYAQACAAQLNLPQVEFINTDARKADYSHATVFFMYTPFKGDMLQEMLDILQTIAQQRKIKVFTYGPCSADVAKQGWLACLDEAVDDQYRLYEFKSIG
jgi:16S rRNA G527 N7-methylase RsmG